MRRGDAFVDPQSLAAMGEDAHCLAEAVHEVPAIPDGDHHVIWLMPTDPAP